MESVSLPGALNHLTNAEVEPPPIVWQNIEEEQDRLKAVPGSVPVVKGRIMLRLAVAACLAVMIFITSKYFYSRKPGKEMAGSVSGVVDTQYKNKVVQEKAAGEIIQNLPGYLIVTGTNGNRVRISDKLAGLVPFFNNAHPAIPKNTNWKLLLDEWTQTINDAAANPGPVNFADPIDLMRFLQKNKSRNTIR